MTNLATLKEHQAVLLELLEEFDRICKKNNIHYMLFAGSALGAVRHKGFIPWDDDLDIVMLRPNYDRFMQIAPQEVSEKYYVQSEFSPHWPLHFSKLRKNNTTCLEKYHPKDPKIHQGIYIDIFPCDNLSDNKFLGRIQFLCARFEIAKNISRRGGYLTNNPLKKFFMFCCGILPFKFTHKVAIQRNKSNTKRVHTYFGGSCKYKTGSFPREWITETVNMQFENLTVPVSAHFDKLLTTVYGDYMTLPPEEDRKCKVHAILVDTEKPHTEYLNYRDGMTFDVYTRSIR